MKKYKLIDLFAGAGGLSLGFANTNYYDIKAFVENNKYAAETYKFNIKNADEYADIKTINFKELNEKYGGLDIVIGGPPCQGFSNANRQHNHAINQNNKLVKEYIRAVLEINPKAFVMENVSMLKSSVHRFYIEKKDIDVIKKYNIETKDDYIFLLDKSLFFNDIINIVNNMYSIKVNTWDDLLFSHINILYKNSVNFDRYKNAYKRHISKIKKLIYSHEQSQNDVIRKADSFLFDFLLNMNDSDEELIRLKQLLFIPVCYQKMLKRAKEIHENDIVANFLIKQENLVAEVSSCAVYDYLTSILGAGQNGYCINKGILSAEDFGIPQKRKRFILIGVKKQICQSFDLPKIKINKTTVYDAISDLENIEPFVSVDEDLGIDLKTIKHNSFLDTLKDSNKVFNHIVPRTSENALKRFKYIKQGQNFHDLPGELKTNTYSNIERTQNTIYKRLKYNDLSGTVVNVRKSMWIHPVKDRAVSIREAARLQTFPDSFKFLGPKDSEYQQVGNAVPPIMAKAIGEYLITLLESSKE